MSVCRWLHAKRGGQRRLLWVLWVKDDVVFSPHPLLALCHASSPPELSLTCQNQSKDAMLSASHVPVWTGWHQISGAVCQGPYENRCPHYCLTPLQKKRSVLNFSLLEKKKINHLNVFLYGFIFSPEACLNEISRFGSRPHNPHFSKIAPLRSVKQSQQARIWSMSMHGAVKQRHVKAQCYPYMRPCEIQHDKSNFIEWDRSPLVWLT